MKKIITFIIIASLLTAFSSCNTTGKQTNSKTSISTTVIPIGYFIKAIVGDNFTINVMVPDGAAPSSYEPTPRQMQQLANSVMYFSLESLGFEKTTLKKIAGNNTDIQIINVAQGITPIVGGHDHGHVHGIDPHMWMSPMQAKTIIKNIFAAVVKFDPDDRAFYTKNFNALMKDINETDQYVRSTLHGSRNTSFLIYHPALSYFARDYSIDQISIELDGKEPSPNYLKDIIEESRKHAIKTLFVQRQFDENFANIVAKETGTNVVVFDPLSENWKETVMLVTNALK